MGIAEVYTDEVHNHLSPYYANWLPGASIEPGDYGTLDGDKFIHEGNVRDLGISFKVIKDTQADHIHFSSEGTRETRIAAGIAGALGKVAEGSARIELHFTRANSVFFNAADCVNESIRSKDALGKTLIDLYRKGEWKKKYVVVTDVLRAGATTIAASREAGTVIGIEAAASVNKLDLSNADLQFRVLDGEKKAAFKLDTAAGLTPLMKLFRIKTSIFSQPDFKPALATRDSINEGTAKKATAKKSGSAPLAFEEIS